MSKRAEKVIHSILENIRVSCHPATGNFAKKLWVLSTAALNAVP